MFLRVFFTLLGVLLPLFLWLCHHMGWPLWLGGFLLLPLAFRQSKLFGSVMGVVAAIVGMATLLMRSNQSLLYYPVLMSAVMLTLFAGSLWRPPSIAERIGRSVIPNLPPRGVRYLTRVTKLWSVFFLLNGCIALWTTTQSMDIWMLWNGFLSYVVMGTLFVSEWVVRRWMMYRYRDELEACNAAASALLIPGEDAVPEIKH